LKAEWGQCSYVNPMFQGGDDGMGEVGNRRESKRQDGGDGVSARWLGTHATEGWRDNRKYWQLEMARH